MSFSSNTSGKYPIIIFFTLAIFGIFSTSCATFKRVSTTDSYEIEKRIRDEYKCWKGTRYCLYGTDSDGIDCSGFVKAVYKNVFNIDLPRTTKEQAKEGRPVKQDKLLAGDLVFFKPPKYSNHVGIFLSGKEFVHASKKKGITISQLDTYYWGKYYWTGRRILTR
jgi:cell wall-associated NlpC family hydrolase